MTNPIKPIVTKDFKIREEVIEWIIRNQFGRRNMSDYSRGVLALKLEDVIKEINKKKQTRKPKSVTPNSAEQNSPMETRDALAKIAGVGQGTIYTLCISPIQTPKTF